MPQRRLMRDAHMSDCLTLDDLNEPWPGPVAANLLLLPLPPDASMEFLDTARRAVLAHLDEMTSRKAVMHGRLAAVIEACAHRLSEIITAMQRIDEKEEGEIMRSVDKD
jgi:hypothetical protein